jgi:hypothetical protein
LSDGEAVGDAEADGLLEAKVGLGVASWVATGGGDEQADITAKPKAATTIFNG